VAARLVGPTLAARRRHPAGGPELAEWQRG
jgi:hypothetical protein